MPALAIAALAAQLGASIYGGIKSGQANKRADKALAEQTRENETRYNLQANRNYLDTNAASGIVTRLKDTYKKNNEIAENKAAVTGASAESTIAARKANDEALNRGLSRIAENSTRYQENAENNYQNRNTYLTSMYMANQKNKAANAANLTSNAGNALESAANLAGTGGEGGVTLGEAQRANKAARLNMKNTLG